MERGWRNTRIWLLLTLVAVAVGACDCGDDPTQNRLKREGEACQADDECETGLCNELPGQDAVCLRKCSAGCVQNELCSALAPSRFACVLEKAGLCETCSADSDCPYPGDRCLALGSERFCGRDCSFDGTCPASYRCTDGVGLQGELLTQQCQPVTGTCECTAASAGQQKPCEESNTQGTCTGVRTCVIPGGFGACSALIPAEEVCNGIDDDCNAKTDEGMGELSCGVGECARTVPACAAGVPQSCQPGDAGVEVCDDRDNDCDGTSDEDFDLDTSLAHCGACNAPCDPPNATGVCSSGDCAIAQCDTGWWDRDLQVPNGCEYPCTLSNGGVEACDGLDNDCDGTADEGFKLISDPANCGVCGLACTPPNASGACVAKQCAIGTCNPGRGDCNQQYPDGCEIDTDVDLQHCGGCGQLCSQPNATAVCTNGQCGIGACLDPYDDCTAAPGCETNTDTSVTHCGSCGNACSFPNATASCTGGTCGFTCLPDFWDLDGNPANGCEYSCTLLSASVDFPDLGFVDANCDGIDGELGNAIFVAPAAAGGNDANPGTRSQPKATVASGIGAAVVGNRRDIYVAAGTFVETVNLAPGKGVYGGYQMGTWARALANVVTVTGTNPPLLISNASGSAAQLLTLLGTSATTPGSSAYGVIVRNSSGVTLEGLTVSAGSGADGLSGGAAIPGQNGSNGGPGQVGCENDGLTCNSCARPLGGTGAPSSCSRAGGAGGRPGLGGSFGDAGAPGGGGTPGGAAVPSGRGNTPATGIYQGHNGASGLTGGAGASGAGIGSFGFSGYLQASTTTGGNGTAGAGGGGGGGGGGGTQFCDSYGSGGGGGGSGGCGGQGGRRGESGGASIGVYLYNSSVSAWAITLTTGHGGRGGNGSGGASGGTGGFGGSSPFGNDDEQDDGSRGGAGGSGGNGGAGGAGGAGGGGPSLGIVRAAGATWNPIGAVNVTLGNGGSGGSSPGGSPGATGLQQALY